MGIQFSVEKNTFPAIANALPGNVERAVQGATFNVLATSQDLVAVDTGFLKGTGRADFEGAHVGIVSYSAEYAPYVEFGTSRMRAQPFLTPAVELERQRFQLSMQQIFD